MFHGVFELHVVG